MVRISALVGGLAVLAASACAQHESGKATPARAEAEPTPLLIRVVTFNVEDVRTEDLNDPAHPRLCRIAEVIQRVRPNILLLNEIAYDQPGAPGAAAGAAGTNGQRFADTFLAVPQSPGLQPLRMRAFMAPVNTGIPSGFDLDNDGALSTSFPAPAAARPDGTYPGASGPARAYGGDCWGFGTFPGQYGMALLVDDRLEILTDQVRTFRTLPWDYIPGAFLPTNPDGTPWFDEKERNVVRLSSKSHWDVPVKLTNGAVVHLLCSHPTPPAFDGPEKRNARRNHDEIRFWADYLDNAQYLGDDKDKPGGLAPGAHFVILGDLNADPDEGSSFKEPMKRLLLAHRFVNSDKTPTSDVPIKGLDPDDTAMFRLRVDYVLPSRTLELVKSGVWREPPASEGAPAGPESGAARARGEFPSDHFPVWIEVTVPSPSR